MFREVAADRGNEGASQILHASRAHFRRALPSGALMSYGANFLDLFRRLAEVVDKVLRGANPADLTVEQPIKFDLAINQDRARHRNSGSRDADGARRRGHRIEDILLQRLVLLQRLSRDAALRLWE
jgi:hypothetical protein